MALWISLLFGESKGELLTERTFGQRCHIYTFPPPHLNRENIFELFAVAQCSCFLFSDSYFLTNNKMLLKIEFRKKGIL